MFHKNKISSMSALFQTICKLAIDKSETELKKLVAEGICLSAYEGEYNPIMLLAKEGQNQAVTFLIDKFQGSRNDAATGYAMAGRVKEVNDQIAKGGNRHSAIYGYTHEGHYEEACILRVSRFRKIMQKYQLNSYQETHSLNNLSLTLRIWLLQGPQLIHDNKLIPDIFWHITRSLLRLSMKHTKLVLNAVHNQFYESTKPTFFGQSHKKRFDKRLGFLTSPITENSKYKARKKDELDIPSSAIAMHNTL